jgi:hypothetical protein
MLPVLSHLSRLVFNDIGIQPMQCRLAKVELGLGGLGQWGRAGTRAWAAGSQDRSYLANRTISPDGG